MLDTADLDEIPKRLKVLPKGALTFAAAVLRFEAELITKALAATNGSTGLAAPLLGMSRQGLDILLSTEGRHFRLAHLKKSTGRKPRRKHLINHSATGAVKP